MSSLKDMSLVQPETAVCPYPYFEKMRKEAPVHFDEGLQAWLITRYEDIQAAARMTEVFSNELGFGQTLRAEWQDEIDDFMRREGYGPHMPTDNFQVDPPLHQRRRSLVNDAFNAKNVAAMEDRIQGIAKELMDGFIDRGEVDLMDEYAMPLPIMTICDLLHMPCTHLREVNQWANSLLTLLSMQCTKEEAFELARDVIKLQSLVMDAINYRRENPGDDLMSQVVHANFDDPDNPQLGKEELLSIGLVLVSGGIDTTRNGISWAIYTLATNKPLFQRLKQAADDNRELGRFIEELLRHQAIVPQLPRFTREEVTIGGVTIPANAPVYLCWASGNRDEGKFDHPDQFDMDRKNVGQHIAFGAGPHRCIGALLAKMEMKCALRELLKRFDDFELITAPEEVPIEAHLLLRGPEALKVRFSPSTS